MQIVEQCVAVHWSLTLEPGSCNDYREEDAQPCDDGV